MRRRRLGNALLLGATLLVALVVSEAAVRVLAPQVTMFPRYIVSEDYPLELPRNAEIVHSQGRLWEFTYRTNELGRRGHFLPVSDSHRSCNVVVLGDSFTFGFGVQDDEVFTEVMSEVLGDGYAVVNGGMGGWGIDSEIKWYYEFGAQYEPGFVVLQFTANDPTDFVEVTTIDNGEFRFHPYTEVKPTWQRLISGSRLLQRSHVYALARNAYGGLQLRRGGRRMEKELRGDDRPASAEGADRYARMLELFASDLAEQNRGLLFVSVTQTAPRTREYIYDVDLFPVVRDVIDQLEASGSMTWVELPLKEMQGHPGSPEGHQWASQHHEIVGQRLGMEVQRLIDSGIEC